MLNLSFQKITFKFFIPLALLIAPFFIPRFKVDFDIATISSIFSLVFAILVGFFIATATTNYLNFRAFLAEEGAYLISLYNLGKLVQPAIQKKLQQTIDSYLIATLDHSLSVYAEKTRHESQAIIDLIDTIEPHRGDKRRIAAHAQQQPGLLRVQPGQADEVQPRICRHTALLHWEAVSVGHGQLHQAEVEAVAHGPDDRCDAGGPHVQFGDDRLVVAVAQYGPALLRCVEPIAGNRLVNHGENPRLELVGLDQRLVQIRREVDPTGAGVGQVAQQRDPVTRELMQVQIVPAARTGEMRIGREPGF